MTFQSSHQHAIQLINQREYVKAHQILVGLLHQNPGFADGYFLLGIINSEIGQFNKAVALIEKAVGIQAEPEYWVYLAKCESILGNYPAALANVDACADSPSLSVSALDTLGVTLSRIGEHQRALQCFDRAIQHTSQQPHAQLFYNFGVSLKFSGDFTGAANAFERAIALNPAHYQAYFARSDLKITANAEQRITQLLEQRENNLSAEGQLHIGHALAIEYQQQQQYDAAFQSLETAKLQWRSELDYHPDHDRPLFNAAMQTNLANTTSGYQSSRPIFVVGMPRSGTTLIERVLSGHSQVGSGGELQDFGVALKELTQSPGNHVLDAKTLEMAAQVDAASLGKRYIEKTRIVAPELAHFVDKLPFNFFYIRLIKQALPNAKVICLLRNPMDTCIGNYRQLFSIHSPYYNYAYDINWVGQFYTQFYQMVTSLADTVGVHIVNYEQFTAEPEAHTRRLLAYCDLDYEAQCVQVEDNQLPVSTASKVQVREPINTRSIGRWKRFEQHLSPLKALFDQQKITY